MTAVPPVRVLSTSDLHLGYQAYGATTPDGRNVRADDVDRAWSWVVATALAEGVDVVTIAGDTTHNTTPPYHALLALRDGLLRLSGCGVQVVIAQGNHDGPNTRDGTNPVRLVDHIPGVRFYDRPTRCMLDVHHGRHRMAIAVFPYTVLEPEATWAMDPLSTADTNVCLIHGAVRGDDDNPLPRFYAGRNALDVGREADRWDVIACGDWHAHRTLGAPHAFYSGAPERTTSNVWAEVEERGVVLWEATPGAGVRTWWRAYDNARTVMDLDLDDMGLDRDGGAAAVNDAMRNLAGYDPAAGAVVRLTAVVGRDDRGAVDWGAVNRARAHVLHLDLRLQTPDAAGPLDGDDGDGAGGSRPDAPAGHTATLRDLATDYMAGVGPDVRAVAMSCLGLDGHDVGDPR